MGSRPPEWSVILGAATRATCSDWTLHVKDVPRINLAKVEELEGGEESLRNFKHVRGWLEDDSRYETVPKKDSHGTLTTDISVEHVQLLQTFGVIKQVSRDQIRGHVKMFLVAEPAKKRYRPIKHTIDVNATLGKDTLMALRFPTKHDICGLVHHGACFIALDFSSYYDQFVYSEEVGSRFCFRRNGSYYRLNTLAMGQRQAVEVAACTTSRLLDFGPRSKTASIIDNVIFVGSREDVIRDAEIFVSRVQRVSAKLNEDITDIGALVQTAGDWGGIHLDFTAKTACLADKTVSKTQYSWEHRGSWTWRTFAAHLGLLFWSWQILELPMPTFYSLLRFVSEAGRILTADESLWDQPMSVSDSAFPALESWTLLALRNTPRSVPVEQAPEWLVATDASRWGWGYFAVNNQNGHIRTWGAPWPSGFAVKYADKLGYSTFTEPQAVVNALYHLLDPKKPMRVRVLTDNTATQASFQRGWNTHSYHINTCADQVRKNFDSRFVFDFAYLPGELNPADSLSRGQQPAGAEAGFQQAGADMRRFAGGLVNPKEVRFTCGKLPPPYPAFMAHYVQ